MTKELPTGTTLSHYRIISKIGAGGMGEVYAAEDTRLDRRVALKLLPSEFTQDAERVRRFMQEAKAASALNHPNIISLYDIGDSEAGRFLVMELVAGRTLRSVIAEGNSVEALLTLGIQMAKALSAAHAAGITHRDIKPDNVMVRDDGYVKVLDFGLARLLPFNASDPEAATLALQTTPGAIMGTLAYLSPEQARGERASYPSDIFALGIVLYEMASGRHPFKAESPVGYLHAITLQTPAPLTSLKSQIPTALNALIFRMLEKEPSQRPTAGEVARALYEMELQGTASTAVEPASLSAAATVDAGGIPGFGGRPAIAVLPFDNRSNDPEQEYFADGLAEDLINRLSLWRTFPVIARNSSFSYKRKTLDVRQIGVDLGARYVVEGSVRKAGNRVRITAQLVDATTGQHVWAKTYDRDLTDVFAVQDEISESIAASLVGDLQHVEHARALRRKPENLEAWELYQRALPLIHRFAHEDCLQARALLELAVALDPQFSTALARLAEVGIWEVMYEWTEDPERTLDLTINQARRAVALDPLDAQARCNLSFALMVAKDAHGALEESRRAAELNPSMPFALAIHAYHWYMAGNSSEESIALVQRAIRLSPRDPVEWLFYDVLSGAYLNAGRFAEGLEAGRRLIALSPNYYWGYLWSAMNAVGLGQSEEAHAMLRDARRVKPELSYELARKCLGTMAPDVDRRFSTALREAGLGREARCQA